MKVVLNILNGTSGYVPSRTCPSGPGPGPGFAPALCPLGIARSWHSSGTQQLLISAISHSEGWHLLLCVRPQGT